MKFVSFFAVLVFISINGFAQSGIKTYYFTNKGKQVFTPDSANYTRKVGNIDSVTKLYSVIEYYPDSSMKSMGQSTSAKYFARIGDCTDYYPGGKVQRSGSYFKDVAIGEHIYYYPNGNLSLILIYPKEEKGHPDLGRKFLIQANYDTLGNQTVKNGNGYCRMINTAMDSLFEEGQVVNGKRNGEWKCHTDSNKIVLTELYDNGVLLSGKSVFANGETYIYASNREVNPEFRKGLFGGMEWFFKNNYRYPKQAYKDKIEGRVLVTYVINKDGSVANVQAFAAPNAELANEAVRLINKTSGRWIPGTQYGRKVNVQYTIPVSFSLNNPK